VYREEVKSVCKEIIEACWKGSTVKLEAGGLPTAKVRIKAPNNLKIGIKASRLWGEVLTIRKE
jgi:hypothetical protein